MVYELHGFTSNLIQNYSIIKGNLYTLPCLKPFLTKEEGITKQRHIKPL